ncbi:hypothetical protein PJW08_09305 [Tenacibaculum finnmarkense]|uniref:hypothetical protein n=1 Tax=Tenacibaculum finnmarkense TaxID=2781243 RepID=UPI001E62F33E|nr:hypothetical protein [Tenacibaculum finnmarkense]MCD8455268.1 hypothetical protein [Tenacibaculum finnmarkense genomovar ulcerans]WCC44002.1 hypothetical protein PJW08_09305 [Tenacibaculum finnmarkense]
MRKTLLLLLISSSLFGQTKIDSIFSIEFQNEPEKMKISEGAENGIVFYSNSEKESFVAMSLISENGERDFKNDLPNAEGLKSAYEKMIAVQIKAMRKKMFIFKDSSEVEIKGYKGYKLTYQDENSKKRIAESVLFLINGINFIATYSKVNEFNEENKNKFLNSITIDTSKEPKQVAEKYDLKGNLLELFLKGVLVVGLFYLLRKYKKTTGNNV